MNDEPDYSEYDYDDEDRNDEIRRRMLQVFHKPILAPRPRKYTARGAAIRAFREAVMLDEEMQGLLLYETNHLHAVIELEFNNAWDLGSGITDKDIPFDPS